MRRRHSRILRPLLLVAGALVITVAVTAVAADSIGKLRRPKSKGARLTNQPRYTFVCDVVQQNVRGGWQLADGTKLSLSPDIEWWDEMTGSKTSPRSGRLAMITGQKLGNTLFVRQATLLDRRHQVDATRIMPVATPGEPEPDMPK